MNKDIKIKSKKIKLNKKSFDKYNKNGYFVIKDILGKKTCQDIKKYAEKNLAEKPKFPISLNVHRNDKNFFNIISDKNIVEAVKFFQKSKIDALNDQMIYKKKNSYYASQSWTFHQDNAYPKAKHGNYVIAHLFLDDSTPNNGGLIFFEGSHVEPVLDYKIRNSHKENKNNKGVTRPGATINQKDMNRVKKIYKKVDIDVESGTLCIMHGNLVHGSYSNKSKTKDRSTYSMAYINKGARVTDKGNKSKKLRIRLN